MWVLLGLLCLPPLSSAVPLNLFQALALTKNESSHVLQTSSTSLAPLAILPTHSEAPALSVNLGFNFKIKLRSQGKGWLGEGPGEASARPRLPPAQPVTPTHSQALGSRFWPEALGGSGWLGTGPADELPSGPGGWVWDSPPAHAKPALLGPAPTPQHHLPLWPRLTEKGLVVPTRENSKELEFKIDIDLTAGLGKEGGLPSNSSSSSTSRRFPLLLPGLRVGISEIASKLGAPGLFGSTLLPETREPPPERNATGHTWEHPGGSRPTPAWALEPGPESSSVAASPGSEGAFVALPGCLPNHPEDCGSPLPEPGSPPLFSLLLPALPLFVPLHSDWNTALAEWGLAWEAHVYGTGSLFALLALLSLLALLCLPCHCPAGCKLLALLHLLLVGAGGARAVLLFGDACGQLELFPTFAVRLLHDLALPCLTSALAITILLLSWRPSIKRSHSSLRHPCLLATLLLLHFSVATGAILAADLLHQFPFLLLASRGMFALLAALLSSSFLIFYCTARVDTAQIHDLKSATPTGSWCPFADAHQWSCAARTALPSASFGLLSAGLHTYAILHILGYGLPPELFGPWAWWALQLACRLCEVGMGLPLAFLGLCPIFCTPSEPWCQCCGQLPCLPLDHTAVKTQILPNQFQWALSQHEKLVVCDTVAGSEADYLALYAVPTAEPGGCCLPSSSTDANDPTADFRPPSPIDLRRSIDEALCSEGLFQGGGSASSSTLSLSLAREPWLEGNLTQAASCMELVRAPSLATSCSSSTAPGTYRSPPASPPPPGRLCQALIPASQESLASAGRQAADTALLREEFMDVCRQIDALSVSSDTIEL